MARSIKRKEKPALPEWKVEDAVDLYGVERWGAGYFKVNDGGHICCTPFDDSNVDLDLYDLVEELKARDINLPVQVRLTDILQSRIRRLTECFQKVIEETEYTGEYLGVFPVKVNQNRQVVEDIIEIGAPFRRGLEAGTKPELLLAIAQGPDDCLIICNGYKDADYIEAALRARKLGRNIFIVVEKITEVPLIVKIAKELDVVPQLGVRAKLHSRGRGKWESSGGEKAKFGLFVFEIFEMIRRLGEAKLLDSLKLLHFHLGSQVTDIRKIKHALREATRIYVEMIRLGVPLEYLDVGGGLAVDYDGSHTNFASSSNYGLMEYAADVVEAVQEGCEVGEVKEPNIITEAGRAMVAHHAFIIIEVLGSTTLTKRPMVEKVGDDAPVALQNLYEINKDLSAKNFQETFHDALGYRDEALQMFNLDLLSLEQRAQMEALFYATCQRIHKYASSLDYVPDELEGLEKFLSDTYYANFSIFKSVPDHWAIKQIFPVVPIHRLSERPTRRGTIVDMTCDSDGKIDQFVDLRDVRDTLELHALNAEEPYYLGIFLVGAYQDVLGDFHNLFGDMNTVHISMDDDGGYELERFLPGDTVEEVLGYVGYNKEYLLDKVRLGLERAVRAGRATLQETARFRKMYSSDLEEYTYLSPRHDKD